MTVENLPPTVNPSRFESVVEGLAAHRIRTSGNAPGTTSNAVTDVNAVATVTPKPQAAPAKEQDWDQDFGAEAPEDNPEGTFEADAGTDTDPEADPASPDATSDLVRLSDGTTASLAEVEEWRLGSMRLDDYRRKTEDVANRAREIEGQRGTIETASQQLLTQFGIVRQLIAERLPPEPDLALLETDPVGFYTAERRRNFELEKVRHVEGQIKQLIAQREQENRQLSEQALEEHNARQRSLFQTLMPSWKDEQVAARERNEIYAYLKGKKASDEDINLIRGSAFLIALASEATKMSKVVRGGAKGRQSQRNAATEASLGATPANPTIRTSDRVPNQTVQDRQAQSREDQRASIRNMNPRNRFEAGVDMWSRQVERRAGR